jgi:hypothetical protein
MKRTYFRTLGELRRSIVGTDDQFQYRGTTGAPVSKPCAYGRSRGSVLLVAWSDRLGYIGVTRCVVDADGWSVSDADGGEWFDQSGEYLTDADGIDVRRAVSDYLSAY